MKAQCLPFAQIPHSTRLFTDFLAYSPSLQPFYPRSPHFAEWLQEEAAALRYDPARRDSVSAILERQNKSWDASPQTLSNIGRLRAGALRRGYRPAGWTVWRPDICALQGVDCHKAGRGSVPRLESMPFPCSGWPPRTTISPR